MSTKVKIFMPPRHRKNRRAMFSFLVRYIALCVDPMGNQAAISGMIGMHRSAFWAASQRGRFTIKAATAMTALAPELDINPLWLAAPESMSVDENGDLK